MKIVQKPAVMAFGERQKRQKQNKMLMNNMKKPVQKTIVDEISKIIPKKNLSLLKNFMKDSENNSENQSRNFYSRYKADFEEEQVLGKTPTNNPNFLY